MRWAANNLLISQLALSLLADFFITRFDPVEFLFFQLFQIQQLLMRTARGANEFV